MNRLAMGLLCLVSSSVGFGCMEAPQEEEVGNGAEVAEVSETSSEVSVLCADELTDVLTGPSAAATRSGVYSSSYEAWQAFDFSNTSMWISAVFQTPAWIGYQWADGRTRTATAYAINFVNGASLSTRAPKDWTLQGSNNGSTWTVVDTRSNQTGWSGSTRRAYTIQSPGAYTRYRLNVTDDNDSRAGVVVISMGRLELLGCRP